MPQTDRTREIINYYRTICCRYRKNEPTRPDANIPQDRGMADSYLRWCAENDVDEFLYLEDCVRYTYEKRRTILLFRFLRNQKFLKAWHGGVGNRLREDRASKAAMATMGDQSAQLISDMQRLLPWQEQFKQRHWIQDKLNICCCSPEYSGGYHPLSRYCPSCPQSSACIERLRSKWHFDVVALRAKRFDLLPAAIAKIAAVG